MQIPQIICQHIKLNKFPPKIPVPPEYWESLANWTAKFACRNKYTARSSWKRWRDEEPLGGMKKLVGEKTIIQVKKRILQLILGGQRCEECTGLCDISDEKRKQWRRELDEIRLMYGVSDDEYALCQVQRHPKSTEEIPAPPLTQQRCPTHSLPIQESIP